MPKKNIDFSSNAKQKKKYVIKKRVIIASSIIISSIVCVNVVSAGFNFIEEKKQEKIQQQLEAKAKMLEEERKRKEEEEARKKMVGVNHSAKAFTYDATIVQQKLENHDYSNNGEKIVFLTFDDGASTTVTPQILDVLKENNVHATFFVTGSNIERGGESAINLVKRAFDEGNAIANHSYSHDYKYLYPERVLNLDNFLADFQKTDELLKEILGPYFSTRVIRVPGGSMSWKQMEPLDTYLKENNMASIDWNALNKDAEGQKKTADELLNEAIKTSQGKEMVVLLMHDTYGKEETAKALPQIIQYYKDNGYEFKTLS